MQHNQAVNKYNEGMLLNHNYKSNREPLQCEHFSTWNIWPVRNMLIDNQMCQIYFY